MSSNLRFTIEIDGIKQFDRVFSKIQYRISDFTPIWEEIAEEFYFMEEKIFENEGNVEDVSKWKDLSTAYAEWKEKHYPGENILHLTGELEESLTRKGASGNIHEIDKKSMAIGSGLKVGKWNLAWLHQRGTHKMPARPPLRLIKSFKSKITRIMRDALNPGNI